jgi:hypothetical protein
VDERVHHEEVEMFEPSKLSSNSNETIERD